MRDRSVLAGGLLVAIVLPIVLSVAIGGGGSSYRPMLGVVVPDPIADAVYRELAGREDLSLALRRFATVGEARAAVRSGTVEAAITLPPNLATGLLEGGTPSVGVVTGSSSPLGSQVATAVATSIQDRISAVVDAVAIERRSQAVAGEADVLAALSQAGIELRLPDLERRAPPPLAFFGPSLTILAAIFLCGASARSLASERSNGVAERWAAGPAPWWAHDLGVALGAAGIAFFVCLLSWALATLVLGVSWGRPSGVLVLLAASALVAAALNLVVLRVAGRAGNKIDGVTAAVVLLVGMLGGHFVPLYQLPPALRGTTLLTPSGWSLRAFSEMVMLDGGPGAAWIAAAVVTAMAAAMLTVALVGPAQVGR